MAISLVPVQFTVALDNKKVLIEANQKGFVPTEFAKIELKGQDGTPVTIKESDLEELVRRNIELLSTAMGEENQNMLIIGQQTTNHAGGRADLVAMDGAGNLVLIELKRDAKDAQQRPEPMELQAIRYAASFATIKTKAEIIDLLFALYVKAHRPELEIKDRAGLSERQLAEEHLGQFLLNNRIQDQDINQSQRVILLASGFEKQTLSACAWLSKNNVDISCLEIYPMQFNGGYLLAVEQKIPPPDLDDFLVGIAQKKPGTTRAGSGEKGMRATLPKMPKLFEWGLIKAGDAVFISKFPDQKANVIDPNTVKFEGLDISFNAWAKKVTGWSAVNIYEWVEVVGIGKTLDQLRRERLDKDAAQAEAVSEG